MRFEENLTLRGHQEGDEKSGGGFRNDVPLDCWENCYFSQQRLKRNKIYLRIIYGRYMVIISNCYAQFTVIRPFRLSISRGTFGKKEKLMMFKPFTTINYNLNPTIGNPIAHDIMGTTYKYSRWYFNIIYCVFENELPRSKLRGILRNSYYLEKPSFLKLFLAETPEQAPRNLND